MNNNNNNPIDSAKYSEWYLKTLQDAKIVDYGPVRGTMVLRPFGYAIWEQIVAELDKRFKSAGVKNAYFPLFIPQSFITKEAKHVEGFAPELAVVTHAGGEQLEEPLVVRPTSETIIYHMFSKWIKSYKDLPLKINQWANVVRWEKRTKPFTRTTEFLWQEGHTAHQTEQEALQSTIDHLDLYTSFLKEFLAIPCYSGKKTESEKFAGAKYTFTMEPIMKDGKALQLGTSHLLEQSFPASFDVSYQDQSGKMQTPWCSSWGVTTRLVGAAIMVHGDLESGLVLPPKVAPIQVCIVPIHKTGQDKSMLNEYVNKVCNLLKSANIRVDVLDDDSSPGARFFACEEQGTPLRLEIGQRDMQSEVVVAVPRLQIYDEKKITVPFNELLNFYISFQDKYHEFLYARAQMFLHDNTFEGGYFDSFCKQLEQTPGFYKLFWCGKTECESKLKEVSASARVVIKEQAPNAQCFYCKLDACKQIIAAKAY